MEKISSLIKRARELAKLANKATPGPWKCGYMSGDERNDSDWGANGIFSEATKTMICGDGGGWDAGFEPPNKDDAALIEAAPEMARLLNELANVVERLQDDVHVVKNFALNAQKRIEDKHVFVRVLRKYAPELLAKRDILGAKRFVVIDVDDNNKVCITIDVYYGGRVYNIWDEIDNFVDILFH